MIIEMWLILTALLMGLAMLGMGIRQSRKDGNYRILLALSAQAILVLIFVVGIQLLTELELLVELQTLALSK